MRNLGPLKTPIASLVVSHRVGEPKNTDEIPWGPDFLFMTRNQRERERMTERELEKRISRHRKKED